MVFHRRMSIVHNEFSRTKYGSTFGFFLLDGTEGNMWGWSTRRVHANKRDMREIPSPKEWCTRTIMCAAASPDVPFNTWHSHRGREKLMDGALARSATYFSTKWGAATSSSEKPEGSKTCAWMSTSMGTQTSVPFLFFFCTITTADSQFHQQARLLDY